MSQKEIDASALGRLGALLSRLEEPGTLLRSRLAILGLALALRIVWGVLVPVHPLSDSNAYDVFAQNIATQGVYGWNAAEPTAYWPVGTSAVYALLYAIFGHSYAPIVVLNILIGVLTVFLVMALAERWAGKAVALLAGTLTALWPLLIQYSTILASEILFNALVLLAFWLAGLERGRPLARALGSGLVLAAACYLRPVGILLLPFLFLPKWKAKNGWKLFLTSCFLAGSVMLLCFAPWTLRNYRVFGSFVLISTNGGTNTWMGNNPDSDGSYMDIPEFEGMNEAARDKELSRQAREYILKEPLAFIGRSAVKMIRLHDRETIGVVWNEEGLKARFGQGSLGVLKILSTGFWYIMLGLAALGVFALFRKKGAWWRKLLYPPLLAWLYFALLHGSTVVEDRYHMPSIPFIAILAGLALAALLGRDRLPEDLSSVEGSSL